MKLNINIANVCFVTLCLLLSSSTVVQASSDETYNILSMDGGGIRGLIPTKVIQFLEIEAFEYAKEQGYDLTNFQYKGQEGKIAMKDLFDMVAGTSTGSIMAAGLAMPVVHQVNGKTELSTTDPQYFADEIIDIYRNDNDKIFDKHPMGIAVILVLMALCFPLFIYFGFFYGRAIFDNKYKQEQFEAMRKVLADRLLRLNEYEGDFRRITISGSTKQLLTQAADQFGIEGVTGDVDSNTQKEFALSRLSYAINDDKQDDFYKGSEQNEGGEATSPSSKGTDTNDITKMMETINKAITKKFFHRNNIRKILRSQRNTRTDLDYIKIPSDKEKTEYTTIGTVVKIMDKKEIIHQMAMLDKAVTHYERKKPLKWCVVVISFIMATALASALPSFFNNLLGATYDRHKLDLLMKDRLSAAKFDNILTDEILIVSYDYNSQQPRFYSKFYKNWYPYIYDVTLDIATASSSAAPTYFKPRFSKNRYLMSENQIDGGVICNNPALYAFKMARYLNNHENIRVLSLGTGQTTFEPFSKNMDKKELFTKSGEFMMMIDDFGGQYYMKNQFKYIMNKQENYVRVQTTSDIPMDSTSPQDLDLMEIQGKNLWNKEKDQIMTLVKKIVDQKIGGKKKTNSNQGGSNTALYTPKEEEVETKQNLNSKLNTTVSEIEKISKEKMTSAAKYGTSDTFIWTKKQMRTEIAEQRAEIEVLRAQVEKLSGSQMGVLDL